MRLRGIVVVATVVAGGMVLATPAFGAHHLVRISEVYPGAAGSAMAEAVELQLMANGENLVATEASIRIYNSGGLLQNSGTFTTNPANGQSQRTMLVGTAEFENEFGIQPDLTIPTMDAMLPSGGSVCFDSTVPGFGTIDCMAWGAATDPPGSAVGTHAVVIPDSQSLVRSIARGCATALDGADDTDNSAVDFVVSAPTLRNNAVAPTETLCGPGPGGGDTTAPETTITKKPKKQTTKKRVRFEFTSSENGSKFECKLDRKPFKSCTSPFRKKVKVGKHKFQVRAIDAAGNVDGSPAKAKFKRIEAG